MKHLFVPYGIALKLKQKGYREECFGYFYQEVSQFDSWSITFPQTPFKRWYSKTLVLAPTYQQLIDWFDKKNIYISVEPVGHSDYTLKYYCYGILGVDCNQGKHEINRFQTRQEALTKAIEEALKLI